MKEFEKVSEIIVTKQYKFFGGEKPNFEVADSIARDERKKRKNCSD